MNITLTNEQKLVQDAIHHQNPVIHVLNAAAGSGKTTLIISLIRQKIADTYCTILVLAPTNKAVQVLNLKFPFWKYRDRLALMTIHSYFSSTEEIADDGTISFPLNAPRKKFDLVIIDESSMLTIEMLESLVSMDSCLLFAGDECQLPPISQVLKETNLCVIGCRNQVPPVFDLYEVCGKTLNFHSLNRCLRNESSDMFRYVTYYRTIVESGVSSRTRLRELYVTHNDVFKAFKERQDCVVLCFTNKYKDAWSSLIRQKLFPAQYKQEVIDGEVFVFSGFRLNENRRYNTSDLIIVKSVELKKIRLDFLYVRCKCQIKCPKCNERVCLKTEKCKRIYPCTKCNLIGKNVRYFDLDYYVFKDQYGTQWFRPHSDSLPKLNELLKHAKTYILSKPRSERKEMWIDYYNTVNTYNPTLDYSYSSTVHKAQGSEWDTVFVDQFNISVSSESDRLMYTAVSRMKKKFGLVSLNRENGF